MKIYFTSDFQNTPDEVIPAGEVLEMWDTTAKRAIKEKCAIEVPEGVDIELFKKSVTKKKT